MTMNVSPKRAEKAAVVLKTNPDLPAKRGEPLSSTRLADDRRRVLANRPREALP